MLAKLLKRKESRHVLQQQTQIQETQEKTCSIEKNGINQSQQQQQPMVQYRYQRPDLLGMVSILIIEGVPKIYSQTFCFISLPRVKKTN